MSKGPRPPRPSPDKSAQEGHEAPNVRALCHRLLVRVQGGAHLSPILTAALSRTPLSDTDRAFVTELTNGTLRHQASLDAALNAHLREPLSTLPQPVRVALRMGAYQLLYLRTSTHAAVDTSVALVAGRYGRLRGVSNAVLRALSREREEANTAVDALAPLGPDTVDAYATAFSQPRWYIRAIAQQLGWEETLLCLRATNERPLLHLRIHTNRITRNEWLDKQQQTGATRVTVKALDAVPSAVVALQSGAVHTLFGYEDGLFCIQDAAAQAVGFLADAQAGDTVLDACAAPGGKTTHLLEQVGPLGRVVAIDTHEGRLRRVVDNATRMHLQAGLDARCMDLTHADALSSLANDFPRGFSCVVLDAPCSGMGTLRRHPELRGRDDAHLPALYALQAQLLQYMAALVAPGGRLVYSVCSPLWAEGKEQAERFVRENRGFRLEPLPEAVAALGESQMLTTWPHRHGLDGFFACRFVRDTSAQ